VQGLAGVGVAVFDSPHNVLLGRDVAFSVDPGLVGGLCPGGVGSTAAALLPAIRAAG